MTFAGPEGVPAGGPGGAREPPAPHVAGRAPAGLVRLQGVHRQSRGTKLFFKKICLLPKYSRSNITMISLRDRASSPQLEEYGARMARLMQAPRWEKKTFRILLFLETNNHTQTFPGNCFPFPFCFVCKTQPLHFPEKCQNALFFPPWTQGGGPLVPGREGRPGA